VHRNGFSPREESNRSVIRVSYGRKHILFLCSVVLTVVVLWMTRHILTVVQDNQSVQVLWLFMAGVLVWRLCLSWTEPTYEPTDSQQLELLEKKVTVNVPVYNEDPKILRKVLQSLFDQTRRPERIDVVDDGSGIRYFDVRTDAKIWAERIGVEFNWTRKENGGKRSAQLVTFADDKSADFFVTMDSDVICTPTALGEALKPFACDERITSVASVVLCANPKQSVVTRFTDLLFLNFQLGARSALSRLKSVLVNSGSFAVYRADVVRKSAKVYKSETFWRRVVQFSDDSLLTLFAYLSGRTVQQPTSFVFTYLPTTLSHHLRQQLRWARGSTIRSVWRFKYLPKNRIAYWDHFAAWMSFVVVCSVFSYLVIYKPIFDQSIIPLLFVFTAVVGYLSNLKYLTIKRSDVSFAWQLSTFLMTPLLLIWTALVLRPLRLYAIATCWKTGWGTRKTVEVQAA
jgi:hyaluronan synthase